MTVVAFPRRTYSAKAQTFEVSGLQITIAGTLCGHIDFAIQESSGRHATYSLTTDDAHRMIAALHTVVGDIQANCLFDRDPLLMPHTPAADERA